MFRVNSCSDSKDALNVKNTTSVLELGRVRMSNTLIKTTENNEELKIGYTTTNKKYCSNHLKKYGKNEQKHFEAVNAGNAVNKYEQWRNSKLAPPDSCHQECLSSFRKTTHESFDSNEDEFTLTNVCNECDIESTKRGGHVTLSWSPVHCSQKFDKKCKRSSQNHNISGFHHLLVQLTLFIVVSQVCVHVVDALFVNEAINDGPFLNNKNDMGFLDLNETKTWDSSFSVPQSSRKGGFVSAFEMKRSSKTTKRSVTDIFLPHLTTVPTPLLTTMRYLEKSHHQKQINLHHRNYELDLERDHALPTSAPNADILKSNSNPTYPNPNRHHSHDRDRHRHLLNSTPQPSLPNILKKSNNQTPTMPMYPGEVPSYSPPARSFFTPPLPPEYQHPFADKPTLRGTNNDAIATNSASYINRRPIPPPSLMPGHERIPLRPPDMPASSVNGGGGEETPNYSEADQPPLNASELDRKKVLNTPSSSNNSYAMNKDNSTANLDKSATDESFLLSAGKQNQEVLPSIRRILSGSNGKNGEIPEVLLKQVTQRPDLIYHHPPSSPVVLLDGINREQQQNDANDGELSGVTTNNKLNSEFNTSISSGGGGVLDMSSVDPRTDQTRTKITNNNGGNGNGLSSTPTHFVTNNNNEVLADSSTYSTTLDMDSKTQIKSKSGGVGGITPSLSTVAATAAAHATWTMAWNTHVYLSVILFTVIAVYSIYKMLTYNKLTHLFSQSYYFCIHFILVIICCARIFYLCYDAYNVHGSFHMFVSEILLNLPATMLSTAFAVLILYLFLKSLNHKNNRYSALIRPLTVVVGCGVHVVLCITLHYVESYTTHQQQQQQQQTTYSQQQLYRKQQQQHYNSYHHESSNSNQNVLLPSVNYNAQMPPRVLSLICQIIYIFVCLSLGLLYLYLYRILKRILRSKSQNYIHGYQNLSYAIHITIATALLFVLLAALQIFGVISISTNRPIIAQVNAEIDWLQWGYQFSLRLIEIAIVTLISWVASLKTSNSSNMGGGGGAGQANGNVQMSNVGTNSSFGVGGRGEKTAGYNHHQNHHSNMAGFFLPCTSSSSQEQFETDYPAVCNANTNLHTYTMRTGKLIYDDSFVLNSLARGGGGGGVGGQTAGISRGVDGNDFQIQQPTYQHPYDTGSLHSSKNHNVSEYGTVPGGHHRYHHQHPAAGDHHHYSDYLTDATTDHYENPNFDLRAPHSSNSDAPNSSSSQKFVKTSTASTNASSIGGSASGSGSMSASQQQMLLFQNDNCYSEPMTEGGGGDGHLNFNNFERPNFANSGQKSAGNSFISKSSPMGYWPEQHQHNHPAQVPPGSLYNSKHEQQQKKHQNALCRNAFDNPDRSSSNSNHSVTSNGIGGIGRYGANGYNSFDRNHYNKSIRKSGTLSNFGGNGGGPLQHSQIAAASEATQRPLGVQTLTAIDRYHNHPRSSIRNAPNSINDNDSVAKAVKELNETDALFSRGVFERNSDQCAVHNQIKQSQYQHQHHTNSDDDDILSGSNVECTNLINNEDGSYITNSSSTNSACGGNLTDQGICSNSTNSDRLLLNKQQQQQTNHRQQLPLSSNNKTSSSLHSQVHNHGNLLTQNHSSGHDTASATSSNSGAGTPSDSVESNSSTPNVVVSGGGGGSGGSMLVAEHGFVRFRAIDDMNNAQGIGIHNASIRNKNRNSSSLTSA